MTEVIEAKISMTRRRIGTLLLDHEGLMICCDICLYKQEKLWIRMPEFWETSEFKNRLCYWKSKELSDEKQLLILNKVFDMIGLNLEKALDELKLYKETTKIKKELTNEANKFTLQNKNTEA